MQRWRGARVCLAELLRGVAADLEDTAPRQRKHTPLVCEEFVRMPRAIWV